MRLRPNDAITVKAKIKAFKFRDEIFSGFPTTCAVCILEAERTEESKRERKEQVERQAKEK